jgi:uncharacterized protein (TIGR01619 family)
MAEKWRPYLCRVNGKLASIFLDLELIKTAPIQSKPWLLWVWVYMQSPRPDGLSNNNEAPTLYKIEDALSACLAQGFAAIPCGRITTEGRREFYFYGERRDGLGGAVKKVLEEFEGYRCDTGDESDPLWNRYRNVLFPSNEDLQRIGNTDVLDALEKKGDVHSVPREVRHWIYFESESARTAFRDAAAEEGFIIESEHLSPSEPFFAIVLSQTQSVQQAAIDETVINLLHLSQSFGGEYDGWETQVVTQ